MEYDLTLFEKGLEELGIALSQEQKKQFITYYEYLVEKNKVMNLTAITEYNEVILKHFLDSLSIVKVGSFDQKKLTGKSVIDIGTGAGFPGIPLKIAFPELKITLLDSLNKSEFFLYSSVSAGFEESRIFLSSASSLSFSSAYAKCFL